MIDSWLLLLLFCAIAIGWLLGRHARRSQAEDLVTLHPKYYRGLNFLLNDQADNSLDAFVDSLEVNSETLETHLAVGNLMRRKGEVDRAIRIHQNLLSRPSLPRSHLHQAHLELARDYISAGLLDRAERLLKDLIEEAPSLRLIAMKHLLEIFQDEREWQEAIDLARQLLPKRSLLKSTPPVDQDVIIALSHYCCELAELSLAKNDYYSARSALKQALGYDRNCVRASLLMAEIECQTENYAKAIKNLRKVCDQDPVFIPEALPMLQRCFQQLDNHSDYLEFLTDALDEHPSATLLLALADEIKMQQGDNAAADFISEKLRQRPSLRGLARLVELHIDNSDQRAKDSLSILQLLIEQLLQSKPQYQCSRCGFSGKHLHWLCPGCKQWGQVKAIRGAEGD